MLLLALLLASPALADDPAPTATGAPVDARDALRSDLDVLLDRLLTLTREGGAAAASTDEVTAALDLLDRGVHGLADASAEPPAAAARATLTRARQAVVQLRAQRLASGLERASDAGDRDDALAEGDALLRTLAVVDDTIGADPDLDAVRLRLVEVATRLDRGRALRWSTDCVERCATPTARSAAQAVFEGDGVDALDSEVVTRTGTSAAAGSALGEDPDEDDPINGWGLLRLRLGATWIVPGNTVTNDGVAGARAPLGGQLTLAWAPRPVACFSVDAGWDRWTVDRHPDGLAGQSRWRLQAGWCPSLVLGARGDLRAALRLVTGVGVGGGQVIWDGKADEPVSGVGFHGRIEIPVRISAFELTPSFGTAPYARGGQPFGRAAFAGLGVAVGF